MLRLWLHYAELPYSKKYSYVFIVTPYSVVAGYLQYMKVTLPTLLCL